MKPETWPVIRGKGLHFTDRELGSIQQAFRDGRDVNDIARELLCSKRAIYVHYARMRGIDGRKRGAVPRPASQPRPAKAPPSRFYRSSFQPS